MNAELYTQFHRLCRIISQLTQNTTIRMLTSVGHRDYITTVLAHVIWLPVFLQAHFKVLVLTFKVIYDLGPPYLRDLPTLLWTYPITTVIIRGLASRRFLMLLRFSRWQPRKRSFWLWHQNSRILLRENLSPLLLTSSSGWRSFIWCSLPAQCFTCCFNAFVCISFLV